MNLLYCSFEVSYFPLRSVIWNHVQFPDDIRDSHKYWEEFGASGYVIDKLIFRLSHEDPWFKSDNSSVLSFL